MSSHWKRAAAVEVDDRDHDRRARGVGEPVDGERGDGAGDVGHALGLHVVHRPALDAHALRRQVPGAAVATAGAGEAELPRSRRGATAARRAGWGRAGAAAAGPGSRAR